MLYAWPGLGHSSSASGLPPLCWYPRNLFKLFKMSKANRTRSAGVYQHPTELVLYAQRRARAGFCMASPPVIRIPGTSTAEEVGTGLRRALDAYQDDLPDPANWKDFRAQFLRATGYKSWKSLEAHAKSCWIEDVDGSISFTPLRNGGSRGDNAGFQPFGKEPVVVLATCADEELGKALLHVLSICE